MARHESRHRGAEVPPRRVDDILLGAARIGDYCRRPQRGRHRGKECSHLPDRRGDEHQIGVGELISPALVQRPDAIGNAHAQRGLEVGAAATDADNARDRVRSLEREGK